MTSKEGGISRPACTPHAEGGAVVEAAWCSRPAGLARLSADLWHFPLRSQTACLIKTDLLQPHTRAPCRALLSRVVGLGRGKRRVAGVKSFRPSINTVVTRVGPAGRQEQCCQNRQEQQRSSPRLHTSPFVFYLGERHRRAKLERRCGGEICASQHGSISGHRRPAVRRRLTQLQGTALSRVHCTSCQWQHAATSATLLFPGCGTLGGIHVLWPASLQLEMLLAR